MKNKTQTAKTPLLSVCLPAYEMGGLGHIYLKESLDKLVKQTFKDFEVILSDYSKDKLIKNLCEKYKTKLNLKYFKNFDKPVGMSANTNNSIRHASGKLLKILFQDDFLFDKDALQTTIDNFDLEKDHWLVSACEHTKDGKTFYRTHFPKYNSQVYLGKNTIGSPSVLTIKNEHPFMFDINLKWLVDCDYYRRLHDAFGAPKIVNDVTVAIRVGEHQITNTEADGALRQKEEDYMVEKYKKTTPLNLKNVTLVAVSGIDPTGAVKALELSMQGVKYYDAVLIAHHKPADLNKKITFKQCKPTELASKDRKNTNDYSRFMAYNLTNYIDSEFVLIVHNDAYVLRPDKWQDSFLEYDYIGAPWPKDVHFTNEGLNVRIGNGGFSLRSKKMLDALNDLKLPFTDNGTGYYHEDGIMCVYYRKELEEYGIKFAPVPLAARFSLEKDCEESYYQPFGFHNNPKAISKAAYIRHSLKQVRRKTSKALESVRNIPKMRSTMETEKYGWAKCPDDNARRYIEKCQLFATNDSAFANFKRDKDYGKILEGGEEIVGNIALKSIKRLKGTDLLLKHLTAFKENDRYGNPVVHDYPAVGSIAPATLRYVNNLLEIKKLIGDFQPKKIVEVGGGYGGLAKTLDVLYDFDEYTLIDLPPVIELCKKYLNHFPKLKNKMRYIYCDDLEAIKKIKDVDLFISDSAFAECDQATQTMYTDAVAKKAEFVYVTFNTLHVKGASNEMTVFADNFSKNRVKTYRSDDKTVVAVGTKR